jgi:urease accessory protein
MKKSRAVLFAACGACGLIPASADAHLVTSGMGPVYDGISHFTLSPEDFLPVVALAFFTGLRGAAHARLTLAVLPLAWLAGGVTVLSGVNLPAFVLPAATAWLFVVIGILLAADWNVSPGDCALAACELGVVRGAADLTGNTAGPTSALALIGMTASAFVVFALAASVTLPLRRFWMIVAARVGGSWLAALGLLFAGWILRFGAQVQ